MTRKLLGAALAAGLGLLATADRAQAQVFYQPQTNPYGQPAISPYLNLTRPGNPAVNLYGLVRPQQDVNRQLQGLQQQQHALMAQLGAGSEDDVTVPNYAITGHATVFFNYSHYFGQAGGNIHPTAPPPPTVIRRQ